MKKTKKADSTSNKKGIVISETEADVTLGSEMSGDPDDFKNAVKQAAERGKLARVFMPIIVFLLLGLVIGYGTWYYQKQSETAEPKKAEEKIQTPPDVSDDSTTVGGTGTDTTAPTDTTTTNPDTPVSSDATADYTMYTVKSGDTLSGIANDHDMTSSELAKYNGLKDAESLQIGQKIKIPN